MPDEKENWGEALAEQSGSSTKNDADDADWGSALSEQKKVEETKQVTLPDFSKDPVQKSISENPDLALVLDIPVTITMEVGSTIITIRNLLQLNQGSVIELDRFAGEPLDVKVNGTLIAHGEVVVVNEKFGIRLTDVISTQERVQKIK